MRRPRRLRRGVLLPEGDVLTRTAEHRAAPGAIDAGEEGRPQGGGDAASGSAVARNAFYLTLGQAATTALAIVMSAAVGRSLGAQDFGLYYLVSAMSAFAYVFVEWGQSLFVMRMVAREPARAGEFLGTALAMRSAFAAITTLPVGAIAWVLGYGARTTWLAMAFILSTLPVFLAQGYGMVFRARDRMGRDATVSVANKVVALAAMLPALALGAGIPGIIGAQAVAGLAALAVASRLYRRLGAPALRLSRATARELLAGGTPITVMTAASAIHPYFDAIILSKLASPVSVGWYGAAKTVLGTLMAPAVILGQASYPRVARASGELASLRVAVRAALRPLLWLAALGGTGTYLFAPTVIGLIYGRGDFGPAATILQIFAPGLFLLFVDILLGNIIYASGGGIGFAVAKIVSVGIAALLDVLLIPWFQTHHGNGGIGVVVAYALSEVAVFVGALIVLRRGTLGAGAALDVARALAAAAATLALFHLLPALPAWAGIPLCVGAFTAASAALGLVNRKDLEMLRLALRRREAPAAPDEPS